MTQRCTIGLLASAVAVLAGCASAPTSPANPSPGAMSSVDAAPCPTATGTPPGPDSLALWVDSGGAFGPPQDWTKAWELAVYRDGTVLRSQGSGLNQEPLSATTIDRVDPCVVDRTAEQLLALAGADFEVLLPTDGPTTTISLRDGATAPVAELKIYNLGRDTPPPADLQPATLERLTRALENRRTVSSLLAGLSGAPQPWTPDRVRLVERTGEPYGYQPPTLTWPFGSLDQVLTRRATVPGCAELSGPDVATLYEALSDAPSQSRWSDPHRTALVAAAPVMPGQPGCPA